VYLALCDSVCFWYDYSFRPDSRVDLRFFKGHWLRKAHHRSVSTVSESHLSPQGDRVALGVGMGLFLRSVAADRSLLA
jgi:hypothetical protein